IWTKFRTRAVDLQTDHRSPWRPHLGRKSRWPCRRRGRVHDRGGALRGSAPVAMTGTAAASVHASAVMVGNRAVLIRGPSGSGKSRLAFDLILAGRAGQIPPATLVGDDRVHLEAHQGQIVVRPAPELAGLIEIRGLGIRRCGFTGEAVGGLGVGLWA